MVFWERTFHVFPSTSPILQTHTLTNTLIFGVAKKENNFTAEAYSPMRQFVHETGSSLHPCDGTGALSLQRAPRMKTTFYGSFA